MRRKGLWQRKKKKGDGTRKERERESPRSWLTPNRIPFRLTTVPATRTTHTATCSSCLLDRLKLVFSLFSFSQCAVCLSVSVASTRPVFFCDCYFIHSTLAPIGLPASTCRSRASGSTSVPSAATSTLSTSRASVCRAMSSTGTRPLNCKCNLFSFSALIAPFPVDDRQLNYFWRIAIITLFELRVAANCSVDNGMGIENTPTGFATDPCALLFGIVILVIMNWWET